MNTLNIDIINALNINLKKLFLNKIETIEDIDIIQQTLINFDIVIDFENKPISYVKEMINDIIKEISINYETSENVIMLLLSIELLNKRKMYDRSDKN